MTRKEKFGLYWLIHFGSKFPPDVRCFQCADFKIKVCEGGQIPIECMLGGSQKFEFETFGSSGISRRYLGEVGKRLLKEVKLKNSLKRGGKLYL